MYFGCETRPGPSQESRKVEKSFSEVTGIENLMQEARKSYLPLILLFRCFDVFYGKWQSANLKCCHPNGMIISRHCRSLCRTIGRHPQRWKQLEHSGYNLLVGFEVGYWWKDKAVLPRPKALSAFWKGHSLNPGNVDHKINKALFCWTARWRQSHAGYPSASGVEPKHPTMWMWMVQLQAGYTQDQPIGAGEGAIEQALEREPDNKTANCLMVETLDALGDNKCCEVSRKHVKMIFNNKILITCLCGKKRKRHKIATQRRRDLEKQTRRRTDSLVPFRGEAIGFHPRNIPVTVNYKQFYLYTPFYTFRQGIRHELCSVLSFEYFKQFLEKELIHIHLRLK